MDRGNADPPTAEGPEPRDQGDMKWAGFQHRGSVSLLLAIVIYLLIADIAVETLLSGSPVRWWVAIIVATYFAAIAAIWRGHALWRRLDWKTEATVALFVFLGLVTLTAWLPGGIVTGVRLLGQTTSTLLIVITGAAVAVSGMMLLRPHYPHPAVKWALAVLAIYAVVAFLYALPAGTTYPDLFRGESLWRWLPRWLQGAFIGAFVLVPAAVLYRISGAVLGTPRLEIQKRGVLALSLSMSLAIGVAGLNAPRETVQAQIQITDRGPGTRPQSLDSLVLPVPRTFDLTHVDPAYFAVALGKDPTRIFAFVRDQVGYEAYRGVLRGARGTLLAMAGNSADRALLLASLLTNSGYQVRFAGGTLSKRDAIELAGSMWASLQRPRAQNPAASGDARAAVDAFVKSEKRDLALIREALRSTTKPGSNAGPSLNSIIQETREHYWIQLAKDGRWTDLDPSFANSVIGQSYARAEETRSSLPPTLYHRVAVKIMVEESDGTRSRTEERCRYAVNAADLSGVSIVLVHVPENWRGPVQSVQAALSSALSETGRIKPVLLVGAQRPIVGEPFPVKVNTTGAGAIQNLLSGAGTRNPVEIGTREWIEFSFDYPEGRSETVVREIFDLVGKAKRARGESLKQDEIRLLAGGDRTSDLTTTVLSIFFTTGRLDARHFAGLPMQPSPQAQRSSRSAFLLRRIGIAFAAISDALLTRIKTSGGTVIRFYPDSPRVLIAEISARARRFRLAVDLRRDHARAAAMGPDVPAVFAVTVMRGVVDGTLERTLVDQVAAHLGRTIDLNVDVSTSLLFERAGAERVPPVLVTSDQKRLDASIPDDARARLLDDVRRGNYALALQRPIKVGDALRYGWWRINPQTGETIAVIDDGLYAVSVEGTVVVEVENGAFVATLVTETDEVVLAEEMTLEELEKFLAQAIREWEGVLGPPIS